MYKLSTLSDSYSGRYHEGPLQPSGLRRTFACPLDSLRISEPSDLRGDFGLRDPSASSEDLRPHYLTFGRWVNLRAPATAGTFVFIRRPSASLLDLRSVGQSPGTGVHQYLRLLSCDLGQPPVYEVMIPNSSPSRARADSDGPNPRIIYHLQPKNVSLRRRLGRAEGNFCIRVDSPFPFWCLLHFSF